MRTSNKKQENVQVLTRHQLYGEVWSMSMVKLSQKYGLSDVGLAKICKKHNIPRPSRGYWAKLRHGKKSRKKRLPSPQDNSIIEIRSYFSGSSISDKKTRQLEEAELGKVQKVLVSDRLKKPHPLVKCTREAIRNECENSKAGWRSNETGKRLDIQVSKELLPRALRIMDALIKALVAKGYEVDVYYNDYHRRYTAVKILEEEVRFAMDNDNAGRLRLYMPCISSDLRSNWRDGKKQRVEHVLDDFIATAIKAAARDRDRRIERVLKEKNEQIERERIQAKIDAYKAEQSRVQKLEKDAAAWHRACQIREYIDFIRQRESDKSGSYAPDSATGKWLEWASRQADRLDPLAESPPSLLDEPPPSLPRRSFW